MKWVWIILGALVGLIALAVLVLFALGFRKEAGHMAGSIEIDRPPEAVWPWLTEPDKMKQWITWLEEIRDESPEVRGPGKKVVWVMNDPNMKQKVEIHGEILAEEPLRKISVRLGSDMGFSGVSSWILEDLGGRTRFTTDGTFEYTQWMAKLFEPLITPQAKKKMQSDQARLKQMVESH